MVETYFFFSLGRLCLCVCTVVGFSFVNGTWDMMDMMDLTLLVFVWHGSLRVRFFSSFIFRHTRKRTGGFGLGWVGLLVHHIVFIFSGTHVW